MICNVQNVQSQDNSEIWHYNLLNGLPSANVYEMLKDDQGFLWFGTDDGVCRFDGQHIKVFTVEDGLADNTVLRCYQDNSGRVWFFHINFLPSYYENGKIKQFKPDQEDVIIEFNSRMVESSDSTLYLGCREGLLIINRDLTSEFCSVTPGASYCSIGMRNDTLFYSSQEQIKDCPIASRNIEPALALLSNRLF